MTISSRLKLTTALVAIGLGSGVLLAPACSVSSDPPGNGGEAGDGNEGGSTSGGTTSTGGTSGGAGEGGAEGGAAPGEGGSGGASGGQGGVGGESAGQGGESGAAGSGGSGGDSGKTCQSPVASQSSARGLSCADYCAAFFADCSSNAASAGFADESECRTSCELFDDAQLCCRSFHVSKSNVSAADCDDAAGDGECN